MNMILAIAAGGAFGSLLRHGAVLFWAKTAAGAFPYGTLFVNVTGSFLIGFLAQMMAAKWSVSAEMRSFLITGILGGFTTFSAFSLDVFKLMEDGNAARAALYVAASVGLSLAAVFAAALVARGMG